MSGPELGGIGLAALGFAVMLGLIALRAPVGLAMLLVGGVGYAQLSSWPALLAYLKTNPYHQFANYTLSVIPLFILMGALAERAGVAGALFQAADRALGRFRGGPAMAVVGACTAFGAICGSSVATTATFGRAALPQMIHQGYAPGLAAATVAAAGTLGILIPPSVILVVYAITTEQNIAKLFQAALIPGLLAALFYCITIAIVARRRPAAVPARLDAPAAPWQPLWHRGRRGAILSVAIAGGVALLAAASFAARLDTGTFALWGGLGLLVLVTEAAILPALFVAVLVVGGIYGGVFTPTEGAAVGAVAMLVGGIAQRRLDRPAIVAALRQTAETAGMIFIILLGSEVFGAFLALSRLPVAAADLVGSLAVSPYAVLVAIMVFYILLGAVMDELAMILLTLPVFFPIVQALDFGLPADEVAIWFGILVLIVVGIGLTAPPIGLNVFVIASLAREVPIGRIYRGVLPFVASDILRLALVLVMPSLALALVRLLN